MTYKGTKYPVELSAECGQSAPEGQQQPVVMCDCLNFCGDDPDVQKGKIEPCEHKKRSEALQNTRIQCVNSCMAIFQGMTEKQAKKDLDIYQAWRNGRKMQELLYPDGY